MDSPTSPSLVETMGTMEDFRVDRTRLHPLTDILVLAVICGADSFVVIALFGRLNEEWLRTFLALPNGIPSHATRDGSSPGWTRPASRNASGTGCRSCPSTASACAAPTTGAGTWNRCIRIGASTEANRLVLAQTAVDNKSNEITAIPELLCMPVPRAASCPLIPWAAGRRLRAGFGSRAPTACCACGPTTRVFMTACRTRGTWNGPGTSPGTSTTRGHGREGARPHRNPPLLDYGRPPRQLQHHGGQVVIQPPACEHGLTNFLPNSTVKQGTRVGDTCPIGVNPPPNPAALPFHHVAPSPTNNAAKFA